MEQKGSVSKNRRRKKRKRGRKVLALVMLFVFFAGVLAALSCTVFFNTAEISVKGKTRYTNEEIIKVSGIETGDNMVLMDIKSAEGQILKRLPYITKADIKRQFPDKVTIVVSENKIDYAFETAEGYLLTSKLKAVEISDKLPSTATLIKCKLDNYVIGETVDLKGNSDVLKQLADTADNAGLNKITQIDFSDETDITMTYDARIVLELGTVENLEKKMKTAVEILKHVDKKAEPAVEGTIKLQFKDSYFERKTEVNSSLSVSSTQSDQKTE